MIMSLVLVFCLLLRSLLWTRAGWLYPKASGEAPCEINCASLAKHYKMLLGYWLESLLHLESFLPLFLVSRVVFWGKRG